MPQSLGSPDILNPASVDFLKDFFPGQALNIYSNCTIAMPGSSVVGSINNIQTINEFSPEMAEILKGGYSYPEISDKLTELTREIANLKNAGQKEKPSILKRVADNVDNIRKISEGLEHLKPYTKLLYAGCKMYLGIN